MVLLLEVSVEELFDERSEEFVNVTVPLRLEHCLVSLSKWESKFEKPFLTQEEKTGEETLYYIECMILDEEFPRGVLSKLTDEHRVQVNYYINRKMTATFFSDDNKLKRSSEIITSELIYYWMIALGIPIECQYWHLNRLLTLIRVCNTKNQPPEKIDKREAAIKRRMLNAKRREQLNTRG